MQRLPCFLACPLSSPDGPLLGQCRALVAPICFDRVTLTLTRQQGFLCAEKVACSKANGAIGSTWFTQLLRNHAASA